MFRYFVGKSCSLAPSHKSQMENAHVFNPKLELATFTLSAPQPTQPSSQRSKTRTPDSPLSKNSLGYILNQFIIRHEC